MGRRKVLMLAVTLCIWPPGTVEAHAGAGDLLEAVRIGGVGGPRGPDLTDGGWVQGDGTLEAIREAIFRGVRREDFTDPRWPFTVHPGGGRSLAWDEYEALAAYVWSLSNGTATPGNP